MSADTADVPLLDSLKIRLADTAPVHCASCWAQNVQARHVDFGASYDGPVLNAEQVVATGVQPVAIDDLVVCEECVAAAARALGMEYVDSDAVKTLRDQLADLARRYAQIEAHNQDMVKALASKPEPRRPRKED